MHRTIDIEQLCADKGLRITEQRKTIARVLGDSEDHPDVETLHARAAAIDPFNWLFVLGAMLILAVRFTPTGFTVMIDRLVARILPKART